MKNVVCPVSSDKVLEAQPRISALLVVALLGVYLLVQTWIIPVFLFIDFYLRGYTGGKYSFIGFLSKGVVQRFNSSSPLIDKAPKIFAARLGMVFSLVVFVFALLGWYAMANALAAVLIVFASVECFFNFCVGCYVYSLFILPRLNSY